MRREGITILVPTSPIPTHPETGLIESTIDAIRGQLPDSPILIAADGWHDGACSVEAYDEFLGRLLTTADLEERVRRRRRRVVMSPTWVHEAVLSRLALEVVDTDLVLFLEHDYRFVGPDVPWDKVAGVVRSGAANMVRFSLEAQIPPEWEYLYLDGGPRDVEGVPLWRTIQWSTRPYLARTEWLEEVHRTYVGDDMRCFLETVLHAVLVNTYREHGEDGWDEWRVFTYAPAVDRLQQFEHTDGRGDAPTRPVTVAYPTGETPFGAPAPIVGAVQ